MSDLIRIGECNRCGDCCRGHILTKSLSAKEFLAFRRVFGNKFSSLYLGHKCEYLKENPDGTTECLIYEERPNFCKEFPAVPEDVKGIEKCSFKFVEDPKKIRNSQTVQP